jgi:hypothetical protein
MILFRRSAVAALVLLFDGSLLARAQDSAVIEAYARLSLPLPAPSLVVICHGFGCQQRTAIGLGAADRAKLAELLISGHASAEAERRAIGEATAWFDRRIGPAAGTTHRIARAGALTEYHPGQMDCVDTSSNNTSLFLVLDRLHLLRHHAVEGPQARGYLLNGRWPHATAVLRDLHTGRKWAIDNWTRKFGERPEIMTVEQWMTAGPSLF